MTFACGGKKYRQRNVRPKKMQLHRAKPIAWHMRKRLPSGLPPDKVAESETDRCANKRLTTASPNTYTLCLMRISINPAPCTRAINISNRCVGRKSFVSVDGALANCWRGTLEAIVSAACTDIVDELRVGTYHSGTLSMSLGRHISIDTVPVNKVVLK